MSARSDSSSSEKVPLLRQIGWGAGGLADNLIMNSLIFLAMPIYNIGLGLDPVKVGIALCIPRFLDAISDPIMGNISDNTRSRWGRRMPYIIAGAVLSACLLPLLWMPPFHSEMGMFCYFSALALLYSLAYSVYVVPYTALGFEMTHDYNERTRVLAWRMYIGLLASMALPWLYKLCLNPIFHGNAVVGARWVSVGVGILIIATGILPVIAGREEPGAQKQDKIGAWDALSCTFRNKPFLLLLVTYVIIITGLFTSSTLGLYVNIYVVCAGSKTFAATLTGYTGTILGLTSYLSLPLITWVSIRWGKREAMIAGLCFALIGNGSLWFALRPDMPYLQLASFFITGLGLQGCWLIVSSMVADICDEDELHTGLRREGVYGAVITFALKLALAITALSGGIVLKLSGYDVKIAEKLGGVPPEVLFKMKFLYVGVQCATFLAAIVLFLFYPITRARAAQTRQRLDDRKKIAVEQLP